MKSIESLKNLKNKVIFLRVDFNVPIKKIAKKWKIENDFRIKQTLPTIKYLLKLKAKIILATHFTENIRSGQVHLNQKSTKYLIDYLKNYFPDIVYVNNPFSFNFKLAKNNIFLIENLRKWPEEEKNDIKFAKKLANLADIYINDAFSVCHRNHASVSKITKFLPSYAGFLLEKEIKYLSAVMKKPKKPFVIILGGAKISTKIMLIKNFLKKTNWLIIGGTIANTLLKAKGIFIGKSTYDRDYISKFSSKFLNNKKLLLPLDVIVAPNSKSKIKKAKSIFDINKNDIILDIGPKTIEKFIKIIKKAKMIIFNGPFGFIENNKFLMGTKKILQAISKNKKAVSIIGGGDTLILIQKLNLYSKFSFVSTGGGAMLKFLSKEKLPGLEALKKSKLC